MHLSSRRYNFSSQGKPFHLWLKGPKYGILIGHDIRYIEPAYGVLRYLHEIDFSREEACHFKSLSLTVFLSTIVNWTAPANVKRISQSLFQEMEQKRAPSFITNQRFGTLIYYQTAVSRKNFNKLLLINNYNVAFDIFMGFDDLKQSMKKSIYDNKC